MDELTKKQIRISMLGYRRLLSNDEYETRNNSVCKQAIELIYKREYTSIHTYLPIKRNKEPDVRPVIAELLDRGIDILVSKTNFDDRTMDHFYLDSKTELTENKIGIPEPVNGRLANIEDVDAILVPLLIADKNNHRLGYGGGFYDRLLEQTNATKIGLSLTPIVDQLNVVDPWDVPLDLIITPNF